MTTIVVIKTKGHSFIPVRKDELNKSIQKTAGKGLTLLQNGIIKVITKLPRRIVFDITKLFIRKETLDIIDESVKNINQAKKINLDKYKE